MGLLEGRLALITGATRGIGRAVALRFAAEGADILVAARSNDDLEALDDALRSQGYDRAVLVPFDVSRPDPAIELSNIVHERYGRLDVLVSNAGMLGTLMPVSQMEPAEFDRVMATNFNALQYQLYAFHDLLRASDAGRIVAVTSGAAVGPRPYWAPYGTAKAAMEFLLQSYAMEVRG
ncbi:MAG: SDR family oxidoreductase, partial [Pseudomonadota bacterium]|nr:SDR family oxidoreductase [Pseudomonadota bacterium]